MPYYIPSVTGTTTDTGDGKITTYTTQFCKTPEYLTNAIKLSIVDKNGECIERLAVRDDTKCEYRFDFANNKAIKQTQFYYVDNENKVQVVGDCVDLQGEQYQATLYKDDTRCELETTNKDYGGGKASFFVTQILFRGIDGLIHNATDCVAYGNIKEELVNYEHNDKPKQSQRVVNQYYTDYYTGEKVYLTQGVRTSNVYDWKETTCGEWEHDDEKLKSTMRTEISFYDDVDYKKVNITACDYSTLKGKAAKYEIEYVKDNSVRKEIEVKRESKNFAFSKYVQKTHTKKCRESSQTKTGYAWQSNISWTTTWITLDKTSYDWFMRADGSMYKRFNDPSGKKEQWIEIIREEKVNDNSVGADETWRKYYEFHSKQSPADYLSQEQKNIGESTEYQSWIFTKYGKNKTCVSGVQASGGKCDLGGYNGWAYGVSAGACYSWIPYSIP